MIMLQTFTTDSVYANPGQFLAKQYTEALGRAPDPSGWTGSMNYFLANGCNKNVLNTAAKGVFLSAEYTALGYDNYEKVLTVYRAILSREPDKIGFAYWVNYLNNGNSLSSFIDFIFQGIDAGELTTKNICSSLGYGWGKDSVLSNPDIPISGSGISTLTALRTALASAAPGSTVYLAQRAVIASSTQIVVPPGVTLATTGLPGRNVYAKQARLVQEGFNGNSEETRAFVKLMSGAKLASVWVSGQRGKLGPDEMSVPVMLYGGTKTTIENSRVENSSGWATIMAHRFGQPCSGLVISGNILTGYANTHFRPNKNTPNYTDGIAGNCENFYANGNDIIDASDVGIIVFAAGNGISQTSKVFNNVIISAGVPMFSALMLHPARDPSNPHPYFNSKISNNKFWSAPDTHFDIGISMGGFPWDGDASAIGYYGEASDNSNNGITTRMNIGMVVDGLLSVSISGNSLLRAPPKVSFSDIGATYIFSCPAGDNFAHQTAHASGALQDSPANTAVHGCVGHAIDGNSESRGL